MTYFRHYDFRLKPAVEWWRLAHFPAKMTWVHARTTGYWGSLLFGVVFVLESKSLKQQKNTTTSKQKQSILFRYTVTPVYNGDPWEMARWPWYTGWPLYTGPLYTGLTVFLKIKTLNWAHNELNLVIVFSYFYVYFHWQVDYRRQRWKA